MITIAITVEFGMIINFFFGYAFFMTNGILIIQKRAKFERMKLQKRMMKYTNNKYIRIFKELRKISHVTTDNWRTVNNGKSASRLKNMVEKEEFEPAFSILLSTSFVVEEESQILLIKSRYFRWLREPKGFRDEKTLMQIQQELFEVINKRYENI